MVQVNCMNGPNPSTATLYGLSLVGGFLLKSLEVCGSPSSCNTIELTGDPTTDIPAATKLLSSMSTPSSGRRELQGAPSDFDQLLQLLSGAFTVCSAQEDVVVQVSCSGGSDSSSATLKGFSAQLGSITPVSLEVCASASSCNTIELSGDPETDIPAATKLLSGPSAPSNGRRELQGTGTDYDQLVQLLDGAFTQCETQEDDVVVQVSCLGASGSSSATLTASVYPDGSFNPFSLEVCSPGGCNTIKLTGVAATDIPAAKKLLSAM
jgi:hypothetical protein